MGVRFPPPPPHRGHAFGCAGLPIHPSQRLTIHTLDSLVQTEQYEDCCGWSLSGAFIKLFRQRKILGRKSCSFYRNCWHNNNIIFLERLVTCLAQISYIRNNISSTRLYDDFTRKRNKREIFLNCIDDFKEVEDVEEVENMEPQSRLT